MHVMAQDAYSQFDQIFFSIKHQHETAQSKNLELTFQATAGHVGVCNHEWWD
jgi:hypothetical protein